MQGTNSSGALQGKYAYSPFGWGIDTNSVHIGFSSEMCENGTETLYYNFRYYIPIVGKWSRRDPMGEISNNMYVYVRNNSLCDTDYLGLIRIIVEAHKPGTINPPSVQIPEFRFDYEPGDMSEKTHQKLKNIWSFSVSFESDDDDCKCPDSEGNRTRDGIISLAQYVKWLSSSWKDDNWLPESEETCKNPPMSCKRKAKYLNLNGPNMQTGIIYNNGKSSGYIDAPHLDLRIPGFETIATTKWFLIEAICTCNCGKCAPCEDDKVIQKVAFRWNSRNGFVEPPK